MSSLGDMFLTVGAEIQQVKTTMGEVSDTLKAAVKEAKSVSVGWSEMLAVLESLNEGDKRA